MAIRIMTWKTLVECGLLAIVAVLSAACLATASPPAYCPALNEPGISGGDQPKRVFAGDRLLLSCCLRRSRDSSVGGLLWLAPDGSPVDHFSGSSSSDDADFILSDSADNGRLATALLVAPRASPERHAGIFVCKDEETGAAASLRVDVARRLRLTAPPVQWLRQGSDGKAVCTSAEPLPAADEANIQISWYRERRKIPDVKAGGGRERVRSNGSTLLVTRALESDEGAYACQGRLPAIGADLDAQIDVRVVQLRVYRKPRILRGPWVASAGGGKAVQGLTNEFACLVDSRPPAQIDWLIQGRPIDFSDPASLSEIAFASRRDEKSDQRSPTKSVLKVFNFMGNGAGGPDESEDSAFLRPVPTFACRATLTIQEAGVLVTDTKELTPQVIYKPRITEKSLMHASAAVGSSAALSCRAQGADAADIGLKFQRESDGGVEADAQTAMSGRVLLKEEKNFSYAKLKMEIKDLQPSDGGRYTCIASTLSGTATYTGLLEVLYPPQVLEPSQPAQRYTWQHHETLLRCSARGNPPPDITWQLNGVPLPLLDTPGVSATSEDVAKPSDASTSTLRVSPLAPGAPVFGRYVCLATNQFGSVESPAVLLLEARRPGTPDVIINKEESTPTSLAFAIVPPEDTGGVRLVGYELNYRVNDGPEIGPAAFNLDDGRITIRYLQPNTNYKVYIAARNLAGVGGRASINYTTGELTPPTSFRLVEDFFSEDPRAFLLRWRVLNNGGLPVDRYRIRIRQVLAEAGPDNRPVVRRVLTGWHSLNPRLPPGQTAYRIERLLPGAHYEIQVRVGNSLGLSERSEVLVFRTPMKPHDVDVVGWRSSRGSGGLRRRGTFGKEWLFAAATVWSVQAGFVWR
ncbi:hypothetical protein BOX15_Mlig016866g1 [Macrostomum lignano]|uniref:Uncharacterized protein n=1 Tax=Macrostomum lignano TaxID=282301 RepID=A0A267GLW0_9PLAT|nr:hypothetical protein BOX15_Mlig016866g1 [Macrostomum lignano]